MQTSNNATPTLCTSLGEEGARAQLLAQAARRGDADAVKAILAQGGIGGIAPAGFMEPLSESIMGLARSANAPQAEGGALNSADYLQCAKLLIPNASLGSIWSASSPPLALATFLGVSEIVQILAPLHGAEHLATLSSSMASAASLRDLPSALALANAMEPLAPAAEVLAPAIRNGFIEFLAAIATPEKATTLGPAGTTPLMVAAMGNFAEATRFLLTISDPHQPSSQGESAIHLAAKHGAPEALEILLAATEPSRPIGSGPLLAAAREGSARCVEMLLPLSNAHERGYDGLTALMLAARANDVACSKILASPQARADVDFLGRSAEDHAWAAKSFQAASLLAELRCQEELGALEQALGPAPETEPSRASGRL